MLVNDLINMFDNHCKANFHPANMFCVDELMVRWCGIGGDWINKGLPMYIAMDWKPKNGCEISLHAVVSLASCVS